MTCHEAVARDLTGLGANAGEIAATLPIGGSSTKTWASARPKNSDKQNIARKSAILRDYTLSQVRLNRKATQGTYAYPATESPPTLLRTTIVV